MPAGHIRLCKALDQHLTSRRAYCSPATVHQDEFVTRRFLCAVGDPYVENRRASHGEDFFHALLDDLVTRDGRNRPPVAAPTWNYYFARIKAADTFLQSRGSQVVGVSSSSLRMCAQAVFSS